MQHLFKSRLLAAFAVIGLTACSENFTEACAPSAEPHALTITAEKPDFEGESRTEFHNGKVRWSEGDRVRVTFCHSADNTWGKYYASNNAELSTDRNTATFEVPAPSVTNWENLNLTGGAYTFYAGYPQNAIGSGNTTAPTDGVLSVTLPTMQTMPELGTFDPAADLMIGQSATSYDAIPETIDGFYYKRLVAHGCVTLKNLPAEAGELVESVTFTAPEGCFLTGNGTVNFTEPSMTALNSNRVTVILPSGTAANATALPVWFCSAPATIAAGEQLTVTVRTTHRSYTRTITANSNGIHFLQNRYNTLGINMASAAIEEIVAWTKVTNTEQLTDGDYLIVYEGDGSNPLAFDGSLTTLDATSNYEPMATATSANAFTLKKQGDGSYTIQSKSGYYIGRTTGSNGLDTSTTTAYTHTVSFDNGNAVIQSTKHENFSLQFNSDKGQQRFRYYSSNQQPVTLYKSTGSSSGGSSVESTLWLELPSEQESATAFQYTYYVDEGATRNYTMYYDTSLYTPLWVAYPLKSGYVAANTSTKYEGSWDPSPVVDKNYQINVWKGGYGVSYGDDDLYSRGHMVPNASRNGYSEEMVEQAYYATNSVPQIQNKFNGSIWGALEGALRNEINEGSYQLYVVTGAVFRKAGGSETITYIQPQHDTKQAPVANYFYKVVLKAKTDGEGKVTSASTVGVWLEHKPYTKASGTSWITEISNNYTCSVDQIETWTGFDFFHNLPDTIESATESNSSWSTFTAF